MSPQTGSSWTVATRGSPRLRHRAHVLTRQPTIARCNSEDDDNPSPPKRTQVEFKARADPIYATCGLAK